MANIILDIKLEKALQMVREWYKEHLKPENGMMRTAIYINRVFGACKILQLVAPDNDEVKTYYQFCIFYFSTPQDIRDYNDPDDYDFGPPPIDADDLEGRVW